MQRAAITMIGVTDNGRPEILLQIPHKVPKGQLLILRGDAKRLSSIQGNVSYANDVKLAILNRAFGLHLAEKQLRQRGKLNLRMLKKRFYITAACHSIKALQYTKYIDAVIISPLFQTASHPGKRTLGAHNTRCIIRQSLVPCYVMGGVKLNQFRKLQKIFANQQYSGVAGTSIVAYMSQRRGAMYSRVT